MARPFTSLKIALLSVSACALLAACGTASTAPQGNLDTSSEVDAAIARATQSTAQRSGNLGSLPYLEKVYKRNSDDPMAAANYAHALRTNDYLNRAEIVLAPFVNNPTAPSETKSEFAAIQLAQGNYKGAEKYAQQAVLLDDNNYQAYHRLGIALDAMAMHEEAERAFRLGLDNWQGDPTAIMNNLALNLASQNYLAEAMEILEKAKSIAPNRVEVERNLRIVRALQESTGYKAPKPRLKPKPRSVPVVEVEAEDTASTNSETASESAENAPTVKHTVITTPN